MKEIILALSILANLFIFLYLIYKHSTIKSSQELIEKCNMLERSNDRMFEKYCEIKEKFHNIENSIGSLKGSYTFDISEINKKLDKLQDKNKVVYNTECITDIRNKLKNK